MTTRPNPPDLDAEGPVPGLERLARERLPPHDLWAGIESRLKPRPRRSAPWAYALAASLCVATVTGLLLRSPDAPPASTEALPPQLASLDAGTTPMSWAEPTGDRLPPKARQLRAESWEEFPDELAEQDSGLVTVGYRASSRYAARPVRAGGPQRNLLRANLKLVTQAERELRRALREDPESQSLRDLLSAAEAKREALQGLISNEHD